MQKLSDELLVAYLDGELDSATCGEVEAWIEHDAALRDRLLSLAMSARLLRATLDPVLHEPVPRRLLAAARGKTLPAVREFAGPSKGHGARLFSGRPWTRWAAAAGVAGLLIGGSVGYFVAGPVTAQRQTTQLASANWLANVAAYHKLFVKAGANDVALAEVPAKAASGAHKAVEKLSPNFRRPNLQPWGLRFQGARFLFIEGQPATQLFYTSSNKALGPLTVVIAVTNKSDLAPTFKRRDGLNMLYWRHHGHAYALVSSANVSYLRHILNDIVHQLDAI